MQDRLHNTDCTPAPGDSALFLVLLRGSGPDETDVAARDADLDQKSEIAGHFEAHRGDILGFLRSRVRIPEQAEDLLQEVFLRVMQRADLSEVCSAEAYLRATARHVLADFYRSQNARDKGIVLEFQEFRHADETWSPSHSLQSGEFLERLAAVLDSLSAPVQQAFVLSRVYGYTYSEIGEALSISPRTVEKHVAKGVARCVESELNSPQEPNEITR